MRKLLLPFLLIVGIAAAQNGPGTGNISSQPMIGVGTTGSIGGSLLLAGACSTGTVTVNGAQPGMPVLVSVSDGTNVMSLGAIISGTVTSANTVTVNVCGIVSLTPAAKTYNVRVIF